jgi:hypothetical protein
MPEGIRNFIDVWITWWHASEPISKYILWWLPVMIWGRIGKILELIGGLYFVIEWIGRERLAEAAAKAVAITDDVANVELPRGLKLAIKLFDRVGGDPWQTLRSSLKMGAWAVATENRARGVNLLVILIGFMFDFLNS